MFLSFVKLQRVKVSPFLLVRAGHFKGRSEDYSAGGFSGWEIKACGALPHGRIVSSRTVKHLSLTPFLRVHTHEGTFADALLSTFQLCSQPQQLSTFALTLFRYNFKHPDGEIFFKLFAKHSQRPDLSWEKQADRLLWTSGTRLGRSALITCTLHIFTELTLA